MITVVQSIGGWRNNAASITPQDALGLVPTMGALHAGHAALLEQARRRCSVVVASIFVNPIQFDQKSDFDRYSRVLEDDLEFCEAYGVDYVFTPSEPQMYPQPQRAFVEVDELSEDLCGRHRPEHFRGVATVVVKLFNILQPRFAFFGEKRLPAIDDCASSRSRPQRAGGSPRRTHSGLFRKYCCSLGEVG
jgi:pantoate--beta-alanine ligase